MCLQEVGKSVSGTVATGDVCDRCDGPLDCFFVNPFPYSTDPLLWRELNDAISEALCGLTGISSQPTGSSSDSSNSSPRFVYEEVTEEQVEAALGQVGLRAVPGGVVWLTASQKCAVENLMVEMEETLAFDVMEWILVDALQRAERSNRRGWQS
jgi:hypothetical protein